MVDWHPFEYFTTHLYENGKHRFTETIRFETLPNGGTRVHDSLKMISSIPRFIRSAVVKHMIITRNQHDKAMKLAAQLANQEFTTAKGS